MRTYKEGDQVKTVDLHPYSSNVSRIRKIIRDNLKE